MRNTKKGIRRHIGICFSVAPERDIQSENQCTTLDAPAPLRLDFIIPHRTTESRLEEVSMTIELYVFPPSPRAFKVLVVANHLALDYEMKLLNFRNRDQTSASYSALNPNMRMPTLKHDDYVLWESNAIQQYLAVQKPESSLLPKDEKARIDVTRWQFWDLAHWDSQLS